MGQPEPQRSYTPEAYFALEQQSQIRHEYFDGEVFAVAGGTKAHNLITQNITLALRGSLRGKGCQVFMEDVRLAVLEWFRRNEADEWVYTVLSDRADGLEIPDLNLRLPLASVYDDTDVAPLQLAPPPEPPPL